MNKENRNKVLAAVKQIGETTLVFPNDSFLNNSLWYKAMDDLSLKDLILLIFRIGNEYPTYEINYPEKIQCYSGAARSATDIWRICKNSRPDITIFEVMQTLYKMNIDGEISTWKCSTIYRRVFKPMKVVFKYNFDTFDEFNLLFNDWAEI